jgi:acetyl-CoA acetyltransferase
MRMQGVVAGVGMTRFAKHRELGLKTLGAAAVTEAIGDAGIGLGDIQAAWVGNCAAGIVTGQESIRGQVILRPIGLERIPIVNVENACASGSTAFNQACAMVTAGFYDVVLALGVEKLTHPDKARSFAAFAGAVDQEELQQMLEDLKATGPTGEGGGAGESRSMFMDVYASAARAHMARYGTTAAQLAAVAAKSSFHGSLNPRAQYREVLTVEEVLGARMVVPPLTLPMCAPIGDGAAAVVVVSEGKAAELGIPTPVRVVSSVLHSGWDHGPDEPGTVELCASEAYEEAGLGPDELSLVECHDATVMGEILACESLELCARGEGGKLAESGETRLGGRVPVNTSGGLVRKGHPVGATGVAQIVELTEQLRGRCGTRQVERANVALAQNGGGKSGNEAAAMCVTILRR